MSDRNTLNYKGDVVDELMSTPLPMGHDMFGAWWVPFKAEYDLAINMTKAWLKSGTYVDMLNFIEER